MSLYQTQLSHLEDLSRQLEGEGLSPPQQSQLASLLTLGIHDRDVILSLRGKQAQHVEDFEWTRWGMGDVVQKFSVCSYTFVLHCSTS